MKLSVLTRCLYYRGTVSAKITCFNGYNQELALSLLQYLEIGRNNGQK